MSLFITTRQHTVKLLKELWIINSLYRMNTIFIQDCLMLPVSITGGRSHTCRFLVILCACLNRSCFPLWWLGMSPKGSGLLVQPFWLGFCELLCSLTCLFQQEANCPVPYVAWKLLDLSLSSDCFLSSLRKQLNLWFVGIMTCVTNFWSIAIFY